MASNLFKDYEINPDNYELVNVTAIKIELTNMWEHYKLTVPSLELQNKKQREIKEWQRIIEKHTYHKLY